MHVYCLSAAVIVLRLFICIVPVCCGFLGISQSEKLKTLLKSFQIDKRTKPQCSGKESVGLKKLGFFSFCEGIAGGQQHNSNFLWLCCLAVPQTPLHRWQSTTVCSKWFA